MTFLVYALVTHPEVRAQLAEENASVLGERQSLERDDIRHLKVARAFINETLRLFPPVPLK